MNKQINDMLLDIKTCNINLNLNLNKDGRTDKKDLLCTTSIENNNTLNQDVYLTQPGVIKKGEWFLLYSLGIRGIGTGYSIHKHDGSNKQKLQSICDGSVKIIASTNKELYLDDVLAINHKDYPKLVNIYNNINNDYTVIRKNGEKNSIIELELKNYIPIVNSESEIISEAFAKINKQINK